MAKKVKVIPATLSQYSLLPINGDVKKKVAGYARVSTNFEDQISSYEAQMNYYKSYIQSHDEWEYAGMYSDEGITGTCIKKRASFNKMIEDALAGKIDLILTKSVSRFARNTVDSISTIRKLKEKGVEVYFEKENIWTLDSKGELLITIMSSIAQEESRSISENIKWGKRKGFANGKTTLAYSKFLGYDKDFKVNEEEARTVRLIYKLYISGLSMSAVKRELENRGIKSPAGGETWYASTVRSILTNEKYKGDALIQKNYTPDFLQKTKKKNSGEIPQYYVEGHHEAIVTEGQFEYVRAEMERRQKLGRSYSGKTIYSSKLRCGCCGCFFSPFVWHSNDKNRKVVYHCNRKLTRGQKRCPTPHFSEKEIQSIFIKAFNSLLDIKSEVVDNLGLLIRRASDTVPLDAERTQIENELQLFTDELGDLIKENSRAAAVQQDKAEREKFIRKAYTEKLNRLNQIEETIASMNYNKIVMENLLGNISGSTSLEFFDSEMWGVLVEEVIVTSRSDIIVVFRGGMRVSVNIL